MSMTPLDVQFEHERALASLTPEQRRALARLQRASQAATFNHHTQAENLRDLFEAEAEALNKAASKAA